VTVRRNTGDTLKRTVLPAFTLIFSPVLGFNPMYAFVLTTVNLPKPGSTNFPSR
jgi:hypothetical protein